MRAIQQYYPLILTFTVAVSLGCWLFYSPLVAYLLLLVIIGFSVLAQLGINYRLKIIGDQININRKSNLDTIDAASLFIADGKRTIHNLIASLRKIQSGDLIDSETLELNQEAKSAVIDLQSNLTLIRQQEQQQNWVVNGIAKIGEIRKSNSTLDDYAYQIVSTLVKYLGANQGAFYLLTDKHDENNQLELLATYAYDKRKFTDGKVLIDVGKGLVGQSVLEREIIMMTEVPKDYVKITSGLGHATPRCITIMPLVFREVVYGVVEVASFQKMEKHHVELINKVSESIAAELADVLRQETTARLLEQSQKQGKELKAQEEELRQNMEEMAATQEEMKRKEEQLMDSMKELNEAKNTMEEQEVELKQQLRQVLAERRKNQAILEGCVDGVISFGDNGKIQFVNAALIQIFGYKRSELLAKSINKIIDIQIKPSQTHINDKELQTQNGSVIGVRTEINVNDKAGNAISVLLTATKINLEEETLFTLFVQKISVDLF